MSLSTDECKRMLNVAWRELREAREEKKCSETKIDSFFRGCSECGYIWEFMYGIGKCKRPNYCPNCGRKVIDDRQGE